MIKNIVFDVGNVLVKWTPEELSLKLWDNNAHEAEIACKYVFRSSIWPEFDLGKLSEDEIIHQMEEVLPIEDRYIVRKTVMSYAHMVGINKETNDWAIKMKKKGYHIYLLTNYGKQFIHNYSRLPIKDYLDGYVCSSDIKMVKPNHDIYEYLLHKYNLIPEETMFIDDLKVNTDAALEVGFGKVITFKGDVKELEKFDN